MKRQIGFAEAEIAGKKHAMRCQRCVAEREKVLPWSRLLSAIEPSYPKGKRGSPPIGLERTLRIYFRQQWDGLSDEGLEDALYDSIALRTFVGIDLAVENLPDAHTFLKSRRLLVEHALMRKLFDENRVAELTNLPRALAVKLHTRAIDHPVQRLVGTAPYFQCAVARHGVVRYWRIGEDHVRQIWREIQSGRGGSADLFRMR